ncbi:MAG: hypothetical protein ACOC80_16680, partial [Petrotogales bacterium]
TMDLVKKVAAMSILFLLLTTIFGCLEEKVITTDDEIAVKDEIINTTLAKNEKNSQDIVQIPEEEIEETEDEEEIDSWPIFIGEHFRKMEDAIGVSDYGGGNWIYNEALSVYHIHTSLRSQKVTRFNMAVEDRKLSQLAGNSRSQGIEVLAQPTKVLPKDVLTSKPHAKYGLDHNPYAMLFDETLLVVWKLGSEKYIQLYLVKANDNLWYEESHIDGRGNKVSQGVVIDFPQDYRDWNRYGVVSLAQEDDFSPGLGYIKCK